MNNISLLLFSTVTLCVSAAPLLSQSKGVSPVSTNSANSTTVRAVVIGIGQYQDSSFANCEDARRDAEEYAAFLQSPPGGGLDRDQILLLTERAATLAGFVAALDWLLDESGAAKLPAKHILYFAGAGLITAPGGKKEGAVLFFYDSPPSPLEGNTFLLHEIENILGKNGAAFSLTASFKKPFLKDNGSAVPSRPASVWNGGGKTRRTVFFKKNTGQQPRSASKAVTTKTVAPHQEKSLSNTLVAALIGLADTDEDLKVTARETFRFLKNSEFGIWNSESPEPHNPALGIPNPAFLYVAVSPRDALLSNVDKKMLDALHSLGGNDLFPPIVHLESMPVEDRLLEKSRPATQQLYEDFILAIKVKNFLPPTAGNAAALYDSLLHAADLQPIAGHLRRRYAAAMLDDTQQALNAYLNNDAKELARRRKHPEQYATYAQLLGKANELLGPRHYMYSSLAAKQLYFEGLAARLQFFVRKDTALLHTALEKQLAALQSEPEAAYILNELGIVHSSLGNHAEAHKQFLAATEFSPTWGIPHANICLLLTNEKKWDAAREYGITAVSLAPRNPAAYQVLANVFHQSGDWNAAERLYLRSIKEGDDGPAPLYDLACLAALRGEATVAFDRLEQAIERGWDDAEKLLSDPDLASLRALPQWKVLMEKHFPDKVKN